MLWASAIVLLAIVASAFLAMRQRTVALAYATLDISKRKARLAELGINPTVDVSRTEGGDVRRSGASASQR